MTLTTLAVQVAAFAADPQVTGVIALATTLFAIFAEMRRRIGRSRRRVQELKLCGDLLDQHRAALEEFLDAPDAPVKLKNALIRFSEVTANRDLAHSVVTAMCTGVRKTQGEADMAKAVMKAVDALRGTQPELAQAFDVAVSAAIGAMLFRWPETADMFREFVTKAVIDHRKGADLFARASRLGADMPAGTGTHTPSLASAGALAH